jgi:hypothetical protein
MLISANPEDSSYANLAEWGHYTDAIGDSNLLVTDDPRWFAAVKGMHGNGDSGVQLAYASNQGLIIYNGFDTDMIKTLPTDPWRCAGYWPTFLCPTNSHPLVDWAAEVWYSELNQSWGSSSGSNGPDGSGSPNGLPLTTPANSIGTVLPPGEAGLPTAGAGKTSGACVSRSSMFLRLRKLLRHHRNVVQVDVYVNGRHVLREKGRPRNVVLRRLPQHRYVTVKIVATTNRRYHLISSVRSRAC